MTVRMFQIRLECDRVTLDHLWRTHRVFNERLPGLLKILFAMRRGEIGKTAAQRSLYRSVAQFVLANSQQAEYLLNSVSIKNWTPNAAKKYKAQIRGANGESLELTGDSWTEQAAQLSADGVLIYDKKTVLQDMPAALSQVVCRECAAIINGHDELTKRWIDDHEQWQRRRADWEGQEEHQKYLALRSRFEEFEKGVGGKIGKRRGRWRLYLDWLCNNPDLAAWRGGEAVVHDLSADAQKRIGRAPPWKTRSVEAEEFWNINPELKALDKLHGYYEREFVRRRKTKKNVDGFDHRPTFTMPDPVRHPRWFVFNAPQTSPQGYRNLRLPPSRDEKGAVELLVVTGEKSGAKYPSAWVAVQFHGDPRLTRFCRTTRPSRKKSSSTQREAFEFFDAHLRHWRPAEISGAKLIFKEIRLDSDGSLLSAVPYLYFTCTVKDVPLAERARKIEWIETGAVTKQGKKRKKKRLPQGLVACAVDLGIRNLGFATIAVYEDQEPRLLRSRNLWMGAVESNGRHRGRWEAGPDLVHLAQHKREIRRLRRLRGKPVAGEESHIALQKHITAMGKDRFKKSARMIVNFALNVGEAHRGGTGAGYPRADVLLLETLEGLIPDAERDRGVNRALVAWNRGQLVESVKQLAKDVGIKVINVNPFGTSQVCSRCGALGRRYSIAKDQETGRADISFGWVEKLFACAECGYRANADHNASVNLHRRFAFDEDAVRSYLEWRERPESERREILRVLSEKLRDSLRDMHRLPHDGQAVPF